VELIASLRWSLDQRPALSDGALETRPRNGRRAWLAMDIYHRRVDGRLGIKYRAVDRTVMILLKNDAVVALSVKHPNVSTSLSIETTVLHEATELNRPGPNTNMQLYRLLPISLEFWLRSCLDHQVTLKENCFIYSMFSIENGP
jgi:hypothetical protein